MYVRVKTLCCEQLCHIPAALIGSIRQFDPQKLASMEHMHWPDVMLSSELAIVKSDGYVFNASVLRHRGWFCGQDCDFVRALILPRVALVVTRCPLLISKLYAVAL